MSSSNCDNQTDIYNKIFVVKIILFKFKISNAWLLEFQKFPSIIFFQKLALREISTSRYTEEFFEVCKLGDGEFGSAYKCVNRLDGCVYAIKKSKMPIAGSQYE